MQTYTLPNTTANLLQFVTMRLLVTALLPFVVASTVLAGLIAPKFLPQLERKAPVTILLYNHITPSFPSNQPFTQQYYYVSTQAFDSQLSELQKRGFQFLSLSQIHEITKNPDKQPPFAVLLTFRDANNDIEEHALPILKKYHAPAVVNYQQASRGKPGFLTPEQVTNLENNSVAVIPADIFFLSDPNVRSEVSGVINQAQFEDLLPPKIYTSALWIASFTVMAFLLTLVAIRWPRIALALTLLALPTYLMRFTLFGVPATCLELFLLVTIGTNFLLHGIAIAKSLIRWPYLIPTIILLVGAGLSTYFAQDRTQALGGFKALILEPVLFGIVIAHWHQRASLVRLLLGALIASSLTVALLALGNYLTGNAYINFQLEKLATYYGNPNYLASYISIGLVACVYFLLTATSRLTRLTIGTIIVPLGVTLYLTKSDTAFLGVVAAIGLLCLYALRAKRSLPSWLPAAYVALAILVPLSLFLFIANPRTLPALEKIGANTLVSRSYIYKTAEEIIKVNPLFGVGLLNFNQAFVEFVAVKSPEQNVALAHNTILDFWAQSGVISLLGYLWLVARFYRVCLTNDKGHDAWMLIALMLTLTIHGFLDSQYHKNDYSVLFWVFIGLAAFGQRSSKLSSNKSSVVDP